MSGHPHLVESDLGAGNLRVASVLEKPFTASQLVNAVADVIG